MNVNVMTKPNQTVPAPLPKNKMELLALRKVAARPTLNDHVEELYASLIEDERFTGYMFAVYDSQAVEGSLSCDNVKAAEMLRDAAKKVGSVIANEKLATIILSLGVVCRRYGLSRKQRRNTLKGEIVENGDGE